MTPLLDTLPRRWRTSRVLLSDRHRFDESGGARVRGDEEGLLLVTDTPDGPLVAGFGAAGRAVDLVTGLVDSGALAAPLRWMSLPRAVDLPARVRDALRVTPLPGWDWMSTTDVGDAPGTDRVERLDPSADLPAILDCLAEANPTTDSDPAGPDEVGWWGVRDAGRLVGVIGAGLRGGATEDGSSWHLHGLGVRPGERRGGLGTALLVVATRQGLAAGADWVSLGVWADNEPALRIYHRLGFRTDHRGRSYRPR